ncbi:hypothetical protein EJ03DRAFT_325473 [Teratosphaeria nubilosa]|uniref:Uncharacterized protein n=1 Tax=Teratosphaeria nubilosa TaxID=161662 RepID=A0A6G1LFP7_9PEZI|nr:hypothetical protein EJ03DRAFT_325473 [Teratosphaeria nubilosa]
MRAAQSFEALQTNRIAPATVAHTVMAEQVSHNVVNQSESASASAPADAIANQTTTEPAGDGNTTTIEASKAPTEANNETANAKSSFETAAEPSAGDAAVSKPLDEHARLQNGVSHDVVDSDGSVGVSSDAEGKRDMHHNRAGSVKKPTTFSKVSVTKTFMAKTASPAPAAAKLGDKPSPLSANTQPANAAKPRLVAKTGALQSIQKARIGSESANGPDASKVWNKNRPAPPQPPKQFTDEELKQQYGIHLATRLQSDENGKEGKWADIDDDEEDWAPETVVWMDGTKSSLTPADVAPPPEQKPRQPEKPAETVRPTLALKKAPEPSGPPRTILKPGIAAQQARQQTGSAAGTPPGEKPSLKAKSPAPAPTKSPWAALPPVAAVSPINLPVQQPPPQVHARMPTQDARAYEDAAPSLPTREIAADTFDRSWREGEGAPRELFNSASGRYEPAPEGRRSFAKAESYARKPSVLQRSQGAAEPSAAFQARSNSQLDGPYSRRRGSSVSQGSLPPARRMSTISKPDLPPVDDSVPAQHAVAQDVRHEGHARLSFAQQSAWDQQMPPKPQTSSSAASPEPAEDLVKKQERVMKEKREEAKRRRQEEEERLEKEKQERLKARLAALEGAGKSRKEREAEAAATQPQTHTPTVEKQEVVQERPGIPAKLAEASATVGPALEAQSLPSAPEKKLSSPLSQKPPQVASLPGLGERPLSLDEQAQRQARDHAEYLSPKAAQRVPFTQQSYKSAQSTYSSPGDRKQQLYRSPLTNTDAFQGWASSGANSNPWSMPGLGNGIFEKGNGFGPMSMGQQASLPPPPGVGRPSSTRISPQGFGQSSASPSLQEQQNAEQQGSYAPPGIDTRTESGWAGPRPNGVSPAPAFGRPSHPPGPIAPPSRAQQQQQQPPVQRPDPLSNWNNAAARLPQQYAAAGVAAEQKAQQEVSAPRDDSTIKDTFRQTAPNQKLGAPRRYAKTEYHVHDPQGSRTVAEHSPAPPSTQTQPIGPVPTASPLNAPGPEQHEPESTVRIPDGSLNPAHGGLPNQQPPIAPPRRRHAAQATAYQNNVRFTTEPLPGIPVAAASQMTSPPPETESHPVFDMTSTRPNVKLPPPSPRVKLPPGPTSIIAPPHMQGLQPPVMMPQRPFQVWGPSVKPIAQTEDWQARFNGLFGRTQVHTEIPPSPPRTPPKVAPIPALAIAASSRTVDDEDSSASATVSLPRTCVSDNKSLFSFIVDDSSAATSKPVIDGIFTAELSFGSLPRVRVPRNVMYDVDVYPGHEGQHNLLRMGPNSKFPKAVDSQSKLAVDRHNLLILFSKHPQGFIVRFPGAERNKLVHHNRQGGKGPRGGDRKPSGKFSKEPIKGGKQPLERAKARPVAAKPS